MKVRAHPQGKAQEPGGSKTAGTMINAMKGVWFGLTLSSSGEGYLGEVSPTACQGFVLGTDGWIAPKQIPGEN